MLSFISDLIGGQPILALFLAIGLGYLVGQINILGHWHVPCCLSVLLSVPLRPGADRRTDRPDRPDHVPMGSASWRPAIL